MMNKYPFRQGAFAHGELRRALRQQIEKYEGLIEREYTLCDDADEARECGYHEGRAQAFECVVLGLKQILLEDDQTMSSEKGEEK